MPHNPITQLFNIQHPIIQAGMVWCSGWKLASAVSEAGGLGIIGAGSMYPSVLRHHLQLCKQATSKPFGVNVPLLYPDIEQLMEIIIEEEVKIVFTSAGNPKTWTSWLKERGCTVVHVVSSAKFALKAEAAGVDAIVAEGFEAGGHNGREETTTLCLLPAVRAATRLPLMAAGGIATGAQMLAAFALGADGVQVGSRFAITKESSAHAAYKERVVAATEGETVLTLKEVTPVRLIKNQFYQQVAEAEAKGASKEDLFRLLGRGRAKQGIYEGNLEEGELEIGQVSAIINDIPAAAEVVERLLNEYQEAKQQLAKVSW